MDKIYLVVHIDYKDIEQWMLDTADYYPDAYPHEFSITLPIFQDERSEVMEEYLDVLLDQMQHDEIPRYAQVIKQAIELEGYIVNQLTAFSFTSLGPFLVLQLENY